MIPKTVEIGPLTLHSYGLIFALSILAGWIVAKKRAHLYKIPKQIFDDPILLVPLVLSIAGARLYHVLDYWNVYKTDPATILNLSGGGLGIWGGLFGLFLGLLIVAKARKLNLLSVLDLVSPSLILGQAIGRFGNWVNQEAFGPPTNLPWGIYISPENRPVQFSSASHFHPTFFYEAILDGIFFVALIYLSKRLNSRGQVFAMYLILYSVGRFIVEFWRIDTWTVDTIKVAHVLAAAGVLIGLSVLVKFKKTGVDRT